MNAQEYLLTCLAEEASEIAKEACKAIRFGLDSGYTGVTNRQQLINEVNDLIAVVEMLCLNEDENVIDRQKITEKKEKVQAYMQVSRNIGTLN